MSGRTAMMRRNMDTPINLNNFEKYFDSAVLSRGKSYYAGGNVLDIREEDENEFYAEVEGSELYTVRTTLDANGNILDTCCDCPYDLGEYCKHQAAVFYALRKRAGQSGAKAQCAKKSVKTRLSDILRSKTKDELAEMILFLVKEDSSLGRRLVFAYGRQEETEDCIGLMQSYIDKAKHDGMVAYRDVGRAAKGIDIVLEKAENHQNSIEAVRLYRAVLSVSMKLLNMADDSDGIIGEAISRALDGIGDIVETSAGGMAEEQRETIFGLILEEASDPRYDSREEWRENLLEICIPLCGQKERRGRLEKYLQTLLEQNSGAGRRDHYRAESIKHLSLALLGAYDGKEAADQFIEKNVQYGDFRKLAIEKAMRDKNYARVLQLALDGEKADAEYRGLGHDWRRYAFAAYKALGDTRNVRSLARMFVLDNEYDFYEELKNSYTAEEWGKILPELLAEMEAERYPSDTHVQILIRENLQDKLLEHCNRFPDKIFRLYRHFDPRYAAQINGLFLSALQKQAQSSDNRSNYRRVCENIKTYQKACGKKNADALIQELTAQYRRKPAFLEELSRLST